MSKPWELALRDCVQNVPDDSDVDYEPGVMALKPIENLTRTLSPEQVASLGWFTLADVAVWPQVPGDQGPKIADALERRMKVDVGHPAGPRDHATAGTKATESLLAFVTDAERRLLEPNAPAPAASTLQQVVTALAKLSNNPDVYWREWLLRVVPAAANNGPQRGRGGTELYDVGQFANYAPQDRRINAEFAS